MTYEEQAVNFGKELLGKIALEITPDETLVVINEFVHTAVDLELTGKQKAEWVLAKVIELALDIWEFIAPLVIKALYDAMMEGLGASDGTEITN